MNSILQAKQKSVFQLFEFLLIFRIFCIKYIYFLMLQIILYAINISSRMEPRELRDLIKNISKSLNIFNTVIYSSQLSVYLQNHKILEIVAELLVQVTLKRPNDIAPFLAENLKTIAKQYQNNVVYLKFQNSFEQFTTIHRYANLFKCPVIESESSDKGLDKCVQLHDFLKQNFLTGKNIILCSHNQTHDACENDSKISKFCNNNDDSFQVKLLKFFV